MKYFKICEPKTSWLLVDTHHHTCAKFAVFSPTLTPNITKNQRTAAKICKFLNIFYKKNCNSSGIGRHAKLTKIKSDFNIFDIDDIITHWTP